MGKEINLSQLGSFTKPTEEVTTKETTIAKPVVKKVVSTDEIAKTLPGKAPEEEKNPDIVDNALSALNRALEERKEFITEHVVPVIEANAMEMAAEKELEELGVAGNEDEINDDYSDENLLDDDNDDIIETPQKQVNISKSDFDFEDDVKEEPVVKETKTTPVSAKEDVTDEPISEFDSLIDSLDDDLESSLAEDDEETEDEMRERFKQSLDGIKVTSDPLDLSSFTIVQNPVSTSNALYNLNNAYNSVKRADWVLYHTGRSVTFTECKGPELDNLRKTINNSNNINKVIASLRFVYDHIEDPNKPSFEAWTKTIRTEDIESLYFGVYKATYSDTNLIGRSCEKNGAKGCGKASIIDTDIDKMVKFKDKTTETKFKEMFNKDTTTPSSKFKSTLIPVSDSLAIACAVPTLYTTFIQFSTLKPEVVNKYEEYLNTLSYITGFFEIDKASKSLIPIAIKEYPNNLNKTVVTKLKFYVEVLKTLNNDQYNVLIGKLNGLIQAPDVTYIYPECECPECGSTIIAEDVDSTLNLLFTRAQLAQIKSL